MKKDRLSDHRPWHMFSPEATGEALTSTEQGLSQQEAGRRITQYRSVFTSPFEKGGLRGIYLIKSPLTPLFQRGGLNTYQYGLNKLTPAASRGPIKRFFSQFHNVLVYVLPAAAGVTAAIGHWVDSGVIAGVVVINALIGFLRLLQVKNLRADESMLTGESLSVEPLGLVTVICFDKTNTL